MLGGLIARLPLPADMPDPAAFIARVAPFVDGFLPDPWLSIDPIAACGRAVETVSLLPPEKPVLLRVTGRTPDETGAAVRGLTEALSGLPQFANLYFLDTPLLYHGNRTLPTLIEWFTAQTSRPLVIENDPARVRPVRGPFHRANIRTELVKTIAKNQGVAGLVHHGDIPRAMNYARAVAARPDFPILDGRESAWLASPSTSGLLSATACVLPEEWGAIASRASRRREGPANALPGLSRLREAARVAERFGALGVAFLLFASGVLPEPPAGLPPDARKECEAAVSALFPRR